MGVVISVNAISRRFSPKSNVALIDTHDFLNGVTDSHWAIITCGNYSGAIIGSQLSCGHFIRALMSGGLRPP